MGRSIKIEPRLGTACLRSARPPIINDNPADAILPQHPLHLTKHQDQLKDVIGDRLLLTDLIIMIIISCPKIRRAGDAAIEAFAVEPMQECAAVTGENSDRRIGILSIG
jgi:hypothetical protein